MAEETQQTEQAIDSAITKAKDDVVAAFDGAAQGDISAIWPLVSNYVIPAASALLVILLGYLLASFLSSIASRPVAKRVDETLGRFIGKLIFYSVMIFTLLGVAGMFGISVASFAAVVAAAGFAVGLAFQGTLSNFASGVLMLVFRPFKVGDVINAAGITAKVNEIDLFTTTFDTFDNRRIIVPNSAIASGTIENLTFHDERRVDVNVGVEYPADLRATRAALSSAAESLREQLIDREDRGYQVYLLDLGDSAVNWVVRFWTKTEAFWGVREQLTAAVKTELDKAGIGIPFPQLDVHLTNEMSSEKSVSNY